MPYIGPAAMNKVGMAILASYGKITLTEIHPLRPNIGMDMGEAIL